MSKREHPTSTSASRDTGAHSDVVVAGAGSAVQNKSRRVAPTGAAKVPQTDTERHTVVPLKVCTTNWQHVWYLVATHTQVDPRDLISLGKTCSDMRTFIAGPMMAPIWEKLLNSALDSSIPIGKKCVQEVLQKAPLYRQCAPFWDGMDFIAKCKNNALLPAIEQCLDGFIGSEPSKNMRRARNEALSSLLALITPALSLKKGTEKENQSVTQSRLLGRPAMLPVDKWPTESEEKFYIPFQCQINFQEITEAVPFARFLIPSIQKTPSKGLLVLFHDIDTQNSACFFYTPEQFPQLEARVTPSDKLLGHMKESEQEPGFIQFQMALSIPPGRNVTPNPVENIFSNLSEKAGEEGGECSMDDVSDAWLNLENDQFCTGGPGMFCYMHAPANETTFETCFMQLDSNPLGTELDFCGDGTAYWDVSFDTKPPTASLSYDC
ncbi:hypothetical protein Pelo_7819 [Pelomyxa schiedti]|nr:hypothetical protein Pelo_7819 [Pelomyxa schiedti]